jgi:hypothetical protein
MCHIDELIILSVYFILLARAFEEFVNKKNTKYFYGRGSSIYVKKQNTKVLPNVKGKKIGAAERSGHHSNT